MFLIEFPWLISQCTDWTSTLSTSQGKTTGFDKDWPSTSRVSECLGPHVSSKWCPAIMVRTLACLTHTFTFIYPLTAGVFRAPQMTSQPVSSIFLYSPLPSGTWRTPGLSIPWCCLPTSSSVCLPSAPFHCALQDGFVQIWWTRDMTIPLQLASLCNGLEVFVWSDCLLDLGTDFLVGNIHTHPKFDSLNKTSVSSADFFVISARMS